MTECNTYNQTFSSFTIECSLSPETSIHQDQTLFIFEIKNAHTEELININHQIIVVAPNLIATNQSHIYERTSRVKYEK